MRGSDPDGDMIVHPARARGETPRAGRTRDRAPASEAGFTFLELLIALTILLFSVVAITGVMIASSYMTTAARQKSAMVNAASGYLERVRQEGFDSIGTPSGDPTGDLVASMSTSGPYTITITPSVAWGRPEDPTNHLFKTVTLTVVASGGGASAGNYSSSAIVGSNGAVTTVTTVEATPTVAVVSPAAGSAVWGTGASITVSATANSSSRTLASLGLYDGSAVVGLVVASGQTATNAFTWNTTGIREGQHSLTPKVTDSKGNVTQGPATILLVDNDAPSAPVSPSILMPDGSSARLWWGAAQDGTAADGSTALSADHYVTAVWQQPSSASLAADFTQWTTVPSLAMEVVTVPTISAPLTFSGLAGFNRFAVAVKASSPDRGTATGLLSSAQVMTGITHPTLTGTWTAALASKKYTVNVTLNVPSGPGFPWSGTASTKFYRLTSAAQAVTSGTLLATVSSSNSSWSGVTATDTQTTGNNGSPTAYWYGAVTTLTPQGYGAASTPVQSSVIGPPANMTGSGTQGMVFSRW